MFLKQYLQDIYDKRQKDNTEHDRGLDVLEIDEVTKLKCISKVRLRNIVENLQILVFFAFIAVPLIILSRDYIKHFSIYYMIIVVASIAFMLFIFAINNKGTMKLWLNHFKIYGGKCMNKWERGNGDADNHYVRINNVELQVTATEYSKISMNKYYYIIRIPCRHQTIYYFVKAENEAENYIINEFYPADNAY